MKHILTILLLLFTGVLFAQNRLDIETQLRQSTTPGSIPVTNNSNNQIYLTPGGIGEVLTILPSGLPGYAAATAIGSAAGNCEETIYAPAHGLAIGALGFLPIHFTGTAWQAANTTTDVLSHDAYLIATPHADSLTIRHCGIFTRVAGDGLTAGNYYFLNDAGGLSSVADTDVDALVCIAYTDYVAFFPPRTFSGSGTAATLFQISDNTVFTNVQQGNIIRFLDTAPFDISLSGLNYTLSWATPPTTGGATTQQALIFNDVSDTYSWLNLATIADQTVSITGAGITIVTGTYPNFTVTSTEVDGSVTNEKISAHTYTASSGLLRITENGINYDATIPVMTGATAGAPGVRGLVPTPAAGQQNSFLRGDGTWAAVTGGQTVTITGAGISVVTGTYPNFTITSTEVDGSTTNEKISSLAYTASSGLLRIVENAINYDATIPVMTGATAGTAGVRGLVPAPAAGQEGLFLRGDGTWALQINNDQNGMFFASNNGATWAVDDYTTSSTATFMSLGSDFSILHGTSDRVTRNVIEGNFLNTVFQTWQLATGERIGDINYGDDSGFVLRGSDIFTIAARSSNAADAPTSEMTMLNGDLGSNRVKLGDGNTNIQIHANNFTTAIAGSVLVKQSGVGDVLYEIPLAPSVLTGNIISPTAISSSINNYSPTNFADAKILRLTSTAAISITGFAGGTVGRVFYLQNVGTNNITLLHESASSATANRFALANNTDIIVRPNGGVTLWYDNTSARWRTVTP